MFHTTLRTTDYDFILKYCSSLNVSKEQFIISALEYQLSENPVLYTNKIKTKTYTSQNPSPELIRLMDELKARHPELTQSAICLRSVANYIDYGKKTGDLAIAEEDIHIKQKYGITFDQEMVDWVANSQGSMAQGIKAAIDLALMLSEQQEPLPPLDKLRGFDGPQVGLYLTPEYQEKLRRLITIHRDPAAHIIRKSFELLRSYNVNF